MSTDGAGSGAEIGAGVDAVVVDARGLRCPLPVIRLAAAARDLPAGTLVTVLSTDPAARLDVPAWARMRGHATVGETTTGTEAETGAVEEPDDDRSGDEDGGTAPTTWSITVRLGAAS
ncbi:sulfurtransferase TusA family protein [Isoptericola sp. NPDC056578]|uniref:sulfurtransferase TusA family protein n=1 Tax=Isoptericola sp. NPDC056578 TaxID=3345870 RepID=UPI00369B7D80